MINEAKRCILSQPTKNEKISSEDDKPYSHGQIRECTSIFKDVAHVLKMKSPEHSEIFFSTIKSHSNKYRTKSITTEDKHAKPDRRFDISDDFLVLNKTDDNLQFQTKTTL